MSPKLSYYISQKAGGRGQKAEGKDSRVKVSVFGFVLIGLATAISVGAILPWLPRFVANISAIDISIGILRAGRKSIPPYPGIL